MTPFITGRGPTLYQCLLRHLSVFAMFYWSVCKGEFCQEAGLPIWWSVKEIGIPMADPWTGKFTYTFTIKVNEIHVDGNIYLSTRPMRSGWFSNRQPTGDSSLDSLRARCYASCVLCTASASLSWISAEVLYNLYLGFLGENRRGGGCCL